MIESIRHLSPCERLAKELPAYADSTLPPSRAEHVERHLDECSSCRGEVDDLRRLRHVLAGQRADGPSVDLSSRLMSIAGDDSAQPLWLRTGEPGELPSRRARIAKRAQLAALSGTALVLVVVTLALLVAPELRQVSDADKSARADFSASVIAVGMSESVAAVLLAQDRGAALTHVSSASPRTLPSMLVESLAPDEAATLLRAIRRPAQRTVGVQRVTLFDENAYVSARVRVVDDPASGLTMTVLDQRGAEFMSGFVPSDATSGDELGAAALDYYLYQDKTTVSGRPAQVLEAADAHGVVARWWFSFADRLLLWSERYGADGQLESSVGYESFDADEAQEASSAPQLTLLPVAVKSGEAEGVWCHGWAACPTNLAGLALVAYSSSGGADETVMHLVYSDGVTTISVVRQQGILAPDGVPVTEYARRGTPRVWAWQSGSAVVTLATNGSAAIAQRARQELPAEAPVNPNLWWQLGAGFERLVGAGGR